jgi:uncharacterized membrane protein
MRAAPGALSAPRLAPPLVWLGLVLALAGAGLAGYLAVENLQGEAGVCTLVHGCDTVQNSRYGKIFGVPVSVPGFALYVALAAGAAVWLAGRTPAREWATLGGFAGALGGFAFSMYLTAIEAFVLEAWCIYCIVSAALMTALAVVWTLVLTLQRRAAPAAAG